MTMTSQDVQGTGQHWVGRIAPIAAGVLAVATLATLLLGLSLVVTVVHVVAVGSVASAAPPPTGSIWGWPLADHPQVTRRFAAPAQPWLSGHRGVDLLAVPEASVNVAGTGVVRYAGVVAGRGVVSVDHPNGLRTTYEPLAPTVRAGQPVMVGDQLGTLVAGHVPCDSACLHWGLRSADRYLDPLALLGRARIRLLPVNCPPVNVSREG